MILLFIDTAGCDMPEAEPGTWYDRVY
jgi:hypothetical protein